VVGVVDVGDKIRRLALEGDVTPVVAHADRVGRRTHRFVSAGGAVGVARDERDREQTAGLKWLEAGKAGSGRRRRFWRHGDPDQYNMYEAGPYTHERPD